MSISASPGDILGWFEKIQDNFKDFRPEAKSMTINYSHKTSSIGLALKIEEGFRKNHNKIKIPAYPGFSIRKMEDASFNQIRALWKKVDNEWILEAKDLPASDGYFLELEGSISNDSIKDLVHIKPSVNRDSNDEVDRYWLDTSLKEPKKLEEIWPELQINEVDVGVKVDVNKMFGLRIPQELQDKAYSIQKYMDAGRLGDRNKIFDTALDFKRQSRKTPFHPNDFLRIIENLTTRETLLNYISVDRSYTINDVQNPRYEGLIPQDVKVKALTTLNLENPQSLGYLSLQRKLYMEKIKEDFDNVLKKK